LGITHPCRKDTFFQQRQDSISKRVVVHALRTRTRHVVQAPQPVTYKPLSPFDDGVWPGMAFPCYLLDTLACKTTQDYSSSFYHLFGFGPATRQLVQFLSVFGTTSNCGRNPRHAPHHTIYRSSVQVSTSYTASNLIPPSRSRARRPCHGPD